MDGARNIDVTAPNTMTLNSKNLNINVEENMTTNVNMGQINTVGMSQTESIGTIKNVTVGGNFMTNVIGKMIEFVKGSIESHTDEERKVHGKDVGISSESNIKANAANKMVRQSGEESNDA